MPTRRSHSVLFTVQVAKLTAQAERTTNLTELSVLSDGLSASRASPPSVGRFCPVWVPEDSSTAPPDSLRAPLSPRCHHTTSQPEIALCDSLVAPRESSGSGIRTEEVQ
jgi:hypothetical protein